MVSLRLTVRASVVSVLLASLAVVGSGVMASGTASASPSTCYPPGSTSCTGTLTASPSTVVRGGTVTLTGKGFAAAQMSASTFATSRRSPRPLSMWEHSRARSTFRSRCPTTTPLGACKITATGLGTNKQTLTLTTTVTVKSATETGTLKVMPSTVVRGGDVHDQRQGVHGWRRCHYQRLQRVKKFTTVASNVGRSADRSTF
jgi:hypothetical protein